MAIIGRRELIAGAFGFGAGLGLSSLVSRLASNSSSSATGQNSAQTDSSILEQAVQRYNSASLEEKSGILSQMYGGGVILVPVNYNNGYEMLNGEFKDDDVVAAVMDGSLRVIWIDSPGGITLNNRSKVVTVDEQGRLRRFYGGKNNTTATINMPQGYSLLIVDELSTEGTLKGVLNGLGRFASMHPDVGITNTQIDIIRKGLTDLGYYR